MDALQSAGDFTPPSGWPVLTADARAWGGLAGVGVLAAAAALSVVRGELDRHGFSVASGSACTASTLEPSHVLVAMGALTRGNVRASLSAWTTDEEVERFLAVLPEVAAGLRARVGM